MIYLIEIRTDADGLFAGIYHSDYENLLSINEAKYITAKELDDMGAYEKQPDHLTKSIGYALAFLIRCIRKAERMVDRELSAYDAHMEAQGYN